MGNSVVLLSYGCHECWRSGGKRLAEPSIPPGKDGASRVRLDVARSPLARSRVLVAVASLAAVVAIGAAAARAGSCRVLVALGAVDFEPSPAGLSARVSGNWEFDNIIQVVTGLSYNVLLIRNDSFVRLHYPEGSYTGTVPGLAARVDAGLSGDDILQIEAAGTNEPTARFVSLEAQRLKVTSPIPGSDGPISVLAYLVLDGDYVSPIISNTITRPLVPVAAPIGDEGDPPPPTTLPPPPPTTLPAQ